MNVGFIGCGRIAHFHADVLKELDANILADVYIHLTGGQSKFEFMTSNINSNPETDMSSLNIDLKKFPIPKIIVSKEDMLANDKRMSAINSKRDSS